MQVAESWAGLMDVTPDAVPVIDEVKRIPGFFIATGFSGHGFGIGPGAGRLMADLVAGDAPGGRSQTIPFGPLRARSLTMFRLRQPSRNAACSRSFALSGARPGSP